MRQSTLAKITALKIRAEALIILADNRNKRGVSPKYLENVEHHDSLISIADEIDKLIAEEERMGLSNIETGDWRKTLHTPPNQGTFPPDDECMKFYTNKGKGK